MANILVVGSANMDVVLPLKRLPDAGETIHAGEATLNPGGKGANAAVAAARMGGDVRFVGAVGRDMFGDQLIQALNAEGIDTQGVKRVDSSTGMAVILLDQKSGQNSILVASGANAHVEAPNFEEPYRWADIVVLQLEIPLEATIEAAKRARAVGKSVLLDPAPAVSELPDELLAAIDILVPNESELSTLTTRSTDTLDEIAEAAHRLLAESQVGQIIVTMGDRGAMWVTREGTQNIDPLRVDAVDTTSAGDTFAAALAVTLSSGKSMQEALSWGIASGALACTRLGAQASIPTRDEVVKCFESNRLSHTIS